MALRFCTDGSITVDTVAEALDFERGRSTNIIKSKFNARPKSSPSKLVDPDMAGTWEGFLLLMEGRNAGRMRKVLALVKGRHPGFIELRELQKLMGDNTLMGTTGTVSGITKNALKVGLDPNDILVRGPGTAVRAGTLLQVHDPPEP